jgi:hypothetical protein
VNVKKESYRGVAYLTSLLTVRGSSSMEDRPLPRVTRRKATVKGESDVTEKLHNVE